MSAHGRRSGWRVTSVVLASLAAAALIAGCAGAGVDDSSGLEPGAGPGAGDGIDAGASGACTAVLPSGCPIAPSYRATIEPLVQRTCAGCHAPGGVAADRDLTTYASFARLETTDLIQLYSCQMPPADAGADAMLSPSEREAMLQWLLCGFPDN